jgi:hypothetical protein
VNFIRFTSVYPTGRFSDPDKPLPNFSSRGSVLRNNCFKYPRPINGVRYGNHDGDRCITASANNQQFKNRCLLKVGYCGRKPCCNCLVFCITIIANDKGTYIQHSSGLGGVGEYWKCLLRIKTIKGNEKHQKGS